MQRLRRTHSELVRFASRLAELRQRREERLSSQVVEIDRTSSNISNQISSNHDVLFDRIFNMSTADPNLSKLLSIPEIHTSHQLHLDSLPQRFYSLATLHAVAAFYILKTVALKKLPARILAKGSPTNSRPLLLESHRVVSLDTPQEGYIIPSNVLGLIPAQKAICLPGSLASSELNLVVQHLVALIPDSSITDETEQSVYSSVDSSTDRSPNRSIVNISRPPKEGEEEDIESIPLVSELPTSALDPEIRLNDISSIVILRKLVDLVESQKPITPQHKEIQQIDSIIPSVPKSFNISNVEAGTSSTNQEPPDKPLPTPQTDVSDEQVAVSELSHLLWALRRRKVNNPRSLGLLATSQTPVGFNLGITATPVLTSSKCVVATKQQKINSRHSSGTDWRPDSDQPVVDVDVNGSGVDVNGSGVDVNGSGVDVNESGVDVGSIEQYLSARQQFIQGPPPPPPPSSTPIPSEEDSKIQDYEIGSKEEQNGKTAVISSTVVGTDVEMMQRSSESREDKRKRRMPPESTIRDESVREVSGRGEKRHHSHHSTSSRKRHRETREKSGSESQESRTMGQDGRKSGVEGAKQDDEKHRKNEKDRHHYRRDGSSRKEKRRDSKSSKIRSDSTSEKLRHSNLPAMGYRSLWFGQQFGGSHNTGFPSSSIYDAYNAAAGSTDRSMMFGNNLSIPFQPFGMRPPYYADFNGVGGQRMYTDPSAHQRGMGVPLTGYDVYSGYRPESVSNI